MTQALLILVEHPLTFGFIILCFLGFIGMTYEFILKLFGRKGIIEDAPGFEKNGGGKQGEPPEPALVKNPDGPDDTLEAQEDIPVDETEE
jgi:hypothetical protein